MSFFPTKQLYIYIYIYIYIYNKCILSWKKERLSILYKHLKYKDIVKAHKTQIKYKKNVHLKA